MHPKLAKPVLHALLCSLPILAQAAPGAEAQKRAVEPGGPADAETASGAYGAAYRRGA